MLFSGVSYCFCVDQVAIRHGFSRQTTPGVTRLDPAVYNPLLPAKIGVYMPPSASNCSAAHISQDSHHSTPRRRTGSQRSYCPAVSHVGTSPLLANYVQELEIFGSKPLILSTELSEARARSCMRRIAFSDVAMMHWFNRLMKGDTDAIVAGLISFLGNLKVLRLGFDL